MNKEDRKEFLTINNWNIIIISIPVIFLIIFFISPLISIMLRSFEVDPFLSEYKHIFKNKVYIKLFINTFKISLITTIICFVVGFPFARLLIKTNGKTKFLLLGFLLFPLITPLLIRTFAWMLLLQNNGVINQIFLEMNAPGAPFELMFNLFGNIIGLVHVFLPYMVFILYDALQRLDYSQIWAAKTLGAKPFRVFISIELPQLYPGIFASCILVFILTAGAFVTPAILGGRKETMVSQIIQDRIIYGSFPLAAAISILFLFSVLLIVGIFEKFVGFRNLFEE